MIALLDLDILVYRIGFACETHYYDIYAKGDEKLGRLAFFETATERDFWVEQYIGSKEDATIKERWIPDKLENCLHSVKVQMEFILSRTGATSYRGFLTGEGNFRDTLVDYYKANRKDARKPYHYDSIREYLIKYWSAEVIDGQEADDALGIAQCEWRLLCTSTKPYTFEGVDPYNSTIICTIDKDLDNIPGWHFNFMKDEKYWVTEEEALLNFYTQLLTGDSTDNIPGLFKITGKKAYSRIKEPLLHFTDEIDMWEYVFNIYTEAMKDTPIEEVVAKLIEIGRLLYIRKEQGEMWCPPKN